MSWREDRNQAIYEVALAHPAMSYREIGQLFNMSKQRVQQIVQARGHYRYHDRDDTPWTVREETILARDYRRKRTREIAAVLGRTKNEVIGKANRMGLCRPDLHNYQRVA